MWGAAEGMLPVEYQGGGNVGISDIPWKGQYERKQREVCDGACCLCETEDGGRMVGS